MVTMDPGPGFEPGIATNKAVWYTWAPFTPSFTTFWNFLQILCLKIQKKMLGRRIRGSKFPVFRDECVFMCI